MENDQVLVSEEYKGMVIQIGWDDMPESPREWDNLGTMICFHKRYSIGDEHKFKSPADFIYSLAVEHLAVSETKEIEIDDDCSFRLSESEFIEKYTALLDKKIVMLPIYLYDHSGLTISNAPFSCSWDSGQIGWCYVTREAVLKEFSKKLLTAKLRKQAENILIGETETYDQYIKGEVLYYQIHELTDPNDPSELGEEIDSCYGFYGYTEEQLIDEAKSVADNIQTSKALQAAKEDKKEIEAASEDTKLLFDAVDSYLEYLRQDAREVERYDQLVRAYKQHREYLRKVQEVIGNIKNSIVPFYYSAKDPQVDLEEAIIGAAKEIEESLHSIRR